MSYRRRLETLDYGQSLATPSPSRLILVTGQSSFRSSRLEPAQAAFLDRVAPAGTQPLAMGFPFHPAFDCAAPPAGLLAASVRNALQVLWCLFSPCYRRSVARALQPAFANTSESLYIVTGSCGLQLLASAWPLIDVPQRLQVRVVALGPALLRAGALPLDQVAAIRGERDFWSRLLYRGSVAGRCAGSHLDYWESAAARELAARLLKDGAR